MRNRAAKNKDFFLKKTGRDIFKKGKKKTEKIRAAEGK